MSLFEASLIPALDEDGETLSGATWSFYVAGTTTPRPVFADYELTTPLGVTVAANGAGRFPPIFYSGPTRAILRNAAGVIIPRGDVELVPGDAGDLPYNDVIDYPNNTIGGAIKSQKALTERIRERIPTFEDYGATGNGLDNDYDAIVEGLAECAVISGKPGAVYRITGTHEPLKLQRFRRIVGFGGCTEALTADEGQAGFKLWFDGTSGACFENANPAALLSHCGMSHFNIRVTGTYGSVFFIKSAVEFSLDWMQIQCLTPGVIGLISQKLTPSDVSWENRLTNTKFRFPDNSMAYVLDHDWSDSPITGTHFTGGLGVIDRGYGARYTSCQFERSAVAGLNVQKVTDQKGGGAYGCGFDANKQYGVVHSVNDDVTTNRVLDFQLVGNTFRTCDELGGDAGDPGLAQVAYFNTTGETYTAYAQRDSAFLFPKNQPNELFTGSWGLLNPIFGNTVLGRTGQTLIDANGVFHPSATTAVLLAGNGSPEGVVDGANGSFYIRLDGSTGTRWYVKQSSLGTLTSWAPIAGV